MPTQEKIKRFLENLKKERLRRLYKSIDNYPDDGQVNYGAIKDVIQTMPDENYKYEEDGKKVELSKQDVIDLEYNNMLQEFASSFDCKVYWENKEIKFSKTMVTNFFRRTLDTNRLQTSNVLITTDLYKQALLSPKKVAKAGYFKRTVYPEIHRINYSEIAFGKKIDNMIKYPVITTIQFDNDINPDETISEIDYTKDMRLKFERLFSSLSHSAGLDVIYNTANLMQDFSIHSYYLPTGINKDLVDNCCLLFRYDHCSKKHYNGAMPKLYKHVYPDFVEEPHFHFNCGFGSVYKLTSKEEQHNFGVGYAIGITRLKDYLEKLYKENFVSKEERKLFMENDFGMPFLHYKMLDKTSGTDYIAQFIDAIKMVMIAESLSTNDAAVQMAYKFVCSLSNTKFKGLDYKQANDNQENCEDSNHDHRLY